MTPGSASVATPSDDVSARGASGRTDRGAATLETVVVAPALLLFILLLALGGRTALAKTAVTDAAWEAARAASIARTPARARSEASAAALAYLRQQDLHCQTLNVAVDTSGFSIPVGQPASVRVTVSCPLDLSGVSLPGLSSRTLTAESSSPLDTYRER
jgi:Flp pilus assembly protein TadG